jgi:lycopene cyclase domain-containing protein
MTYSQIAIAAAIIAIIIDLTVSSQPLLKRRAFWASYAIILPFQLLTNWWLTSRNIVMYSPDAIFGLTYCIGSGRRSSLWFCLNSWRNGYLGIPGQARNF